MSPILQFSTALNQVNQMQDESTKKRLYFTVEKICIGSYDEVSKYEQETRQSYWASDFFQLPPDYSFVGQTLDQINLAQTEWRYKNMKSLRLRSLVSTPL